MELLMSSKRAWLLSYFIFVILECVLFLFARGNDGGKTALILIGEMQILILLFFFFIVIFKWKSFCRAFLVILYLIGTVYLGVNHIICKWYIIIPISIVLIVYMFWNIGGVVNCIVANRYKVYLDTTLKNNYELYDAYKEKVEKYNTRNQLGFWTKVRAKKEPNWYRLGFNSSGLQMFCIVDAFFGVSTIVWEQNISKLKKINANLFDKHGALDNNYSLYEEKETIDRIRNKNNDMGGSTDFFGKQEEMLNNKIESNRKKEIRILKRRL